MGHYRSGYGLQIYNDIEARQFILNVYGARAAASFLLAFPPARPQSNPITTATMKLALSTLLVGSAAAFAPGAPASRSATQLHESKVR